MNNEDDRDLLECHVYFVEQTRLSRTKLVQNSRVNDSANIVDWFTYSLWNNRD